MYSVCSNLGSKFFSNLCEMEERYFLLLMALGTAAVVSINASLLTVDIYYPESGLNTNYINNLDGNIFSIGYSSLPYNTDIVNHYAAMGFQFYPWFGNYTMYVNNQTHYQGPDHWRMSITLDDEFSGDLYIDLSMNFYSDGETGTVYACDAQYSMGTCQPRHSPWQVYVPPTSSSDLVGGEEKEEAHLVMHPAFSTTGVGEIYTIFKNYYSTALDNYRDISVYVPWSLLENPISTERDINAIVLLDGDENTTSLFATQGGFYKCLSRMYNMFLMF